MGFQENLKKYREKAGYKQGKDFAKDLGIPYPTYMGYENRGREPKFDTLIKMADALHVSIDELVGYNPKHPSQLSIAMEDVARHGFTVFSQKGNKKSNIWIKIIDSKEEEEDDVLCLIDGKTLIAISKGVEEMALGAYNDAKRERYKIAFDQVHQANLQSLYEHLRDDPQFKETRKLLESRIPYFFDKENVVDDKTDDK